MAVPELAAEGPARLIEQQGELSRLVFLATGAEMTQETRRCVRYPLLPGTTVRWRREGEDEQCGSVMAMPPRPKDGRLLYAIETDGKKQPIDEAWITLVEEPDAVCFGLAYRVAPADRAVVLEGLDRRESGGYRRIAAELELDGPAPGGAARVRALTYVATPGNPSYLGPARLEEIAAQVRHARGPSGANPEYVLRLAEALRALGAEDPHVFALEALLRADGAGAGSGGAR